MARTYRLASMTTNSRKIHLSNRGDALAEGLIRTVALNWKDGYRSLCLQTVNDAADLVDWAKANRNAVSPAYVRSVVTGRFVSLASI